MSTIDTRQAVARKPLRLWPGVVLVIVQWFGKLVLPALVPAAAGVGVLAGLATAPLILVWWLFFSRAPWLERLAAIATMVGAVYVTKPFVHASIAGGAQGFLPIVLAIPTLSLALVVWAAATRRLSTVPRLASMVVWLGLGAGVWTLARTDGVRGGGFDLRWRWTPTAEERLLAQQEAGATRVAAPSATPVAPAVPEHAAPEPTAPPASTPAAAPPAVATVQPAESAATEAVAAPPAAPAKPADWPGFRGPNRDGVIENVRIDTNWASSPPVELWRRPIGPGWSSFAVDGNRLYTQEQRGDEEIVACYDAATGEPIWLHRDATRFWESNGGAGPRATPTLSGGRVYTLGATGIVNALDADDGRVVWSRNAVRDSGRKVPYWGMSGSPLVAGDLVIVAASGRLIAYDRGTGRPRWQGPADGGVSYSSPQLLTIDGEAQVLLQHDKGASSLALANGRRLWKHQWDGGAIVQPALAPDGGVLLSTNGSTGGNGIRRVAVSKGPNGWSAQERWTSTGLKPYFNDFVLHEGHAYGFDGSILSCIDLVDGTRKWKGGRFGNGQMVVLRDQDVLLVLSEDGELGLVQAKSDKFTELARVRALDAKTWTHPVVVAGVLYVRSGEEMAAFRLPAARQ